jgi:hypothetical protein
MSWAVSVNGGVKSVNPLIDDCAADPPAPPADLDDISELIGRLNRTSSCYRQLLEMAQDNNRFIELLDHVVAKRLADLL